MADDTQGTFCVECGRRLDEPTDLKTEERQPCPACGSLAREFRVAFTGGVTIGTAFESDQAMPITVRGGAPPEPSVGVRKYLEDHESYVLSWSQSESGMWFGEVRDESGNLKEVAIQETAEDVVLVLWESLVPSSGDPGGPPVG